MEVEQSPLDTDLNKQELPNATAVLVLGIASIPACCCYGLPGLIMAIVALALASKDFKMYRQAPQLYKNSSFKNLEAGRICAIVGVAVSGLYFIITILKFFLSFAFLSLASFL